VIQPSEDTGSYIKFANLCRKEGRWTLAEAVIRNLLQDGNTQDGPAKAHPAVVFAHLKLLWEVGDQTETLGFLTGVCASLAREIGLDDPRRVITGNLEEIQEIRRLLSKAYLRQGQWRRQLQPQWTPELIRDVVQCYNFATQLDPQRYKAWHTWALCNFDIIQHLENVEEDHDEEVQTKALLSHILAAIIGKSIECMFHREADFPQVSSVPFHLGVKTQSRTPFVY
jgi:serine/threonine-protein kinase mTOR